ncbi:MAG: transglycosylase SLT domain-containing protein [Deltaproteobacteria bacterium]|jgi:membrane-bound lytic murein transglycosylase D|nr:transglycosylase SLT domain-containing protein [Deltaproteobacteria bacterium]
MKAFINFIFLVLFFSIFSVIKVEAAEAESYFYTAPENIFQRRGLEDRINFWKGIFTKYGEKQDVFHYRDYPWIVYSVVDYEKKSQILEDFQLRDFRKKNNQAEIKKIRKALTRLAEGKKPSNELESRIERLFSKFSTPRKYYKLALEDGQIRYQTGIRERFMDGIRRSGRYLYIIEDELAKSGVPVELSRLPLVESSFNYEAYSSVGAAGIWQFMRSTGKIYNMTINNQIDERRDPIESTQAAARYLKNSYNNLGVWSVAITSYNHGLAGMQRAVKDTGSKNMATIINQYNGKTFGFASKNFYTEFIAALEVEKNYKHYFPELEKEAPWYVDKIKLNSSYTFKQLVSTSEMSQDQFLWYNRAIMSPVIKGRAKVPAGYVLKVPEGKGKIVVAKLKIGGNMLSEKTTVVAKAKTKNNNVIVAKAKRSKNTKLASNKSVSKKKGSNMIAYKVRRGDTVASIAKKFSMSKKEVIAYNNIKNPSKLRAGQTLKVSKENV